MFLVCVSPLPYTVRPNRSDYVLPSLAIIGPATHEDPEGGSTLNSVHAPGLCHLVPCAHTTV